MFRGGSDRGRDGSSSQAGRVAGPKVTAVADERSNALVVSASEDQMVLVRDLIKQVDVDVDDVAELRVFKLRHADPQETADQLATLFPDPTQQSNSSSRWGSRGFGFFGGFSDRDRDRSRSSSSGSPESRRVQQSRVSAVPDPRTSSVIVSASRTLMPNIAGIIEELDSDPAKKKKVFVIPVENRDPQELVDQLQSVISTDSSGNFNQNRSTRQSGSQLSNRQQQNLQNQGNNNNGALGGSSFGNSGGLNRSGR
jgi:type II secretory pathway component GspD/PulD (secretin)